MRSFAETHHVIAAQHVMLDSTRQERNAYQTCSYGSVLPSASKSIHYGRLEANL